MRQPIESRNITISRSKFTVDYPASFMLIATMNPCPCGYNNHPEKECICGTSLIQRYLSKISGPLLDRIDLHPEVTPIEFNELTSSRKSENSKLSRESVMQARAMQAGSFQQNPHVHCNAQMSSKAVREACMISETGNQLLKTAMERLNLSAIAYDRILKVVRTIADKVNSESIENQHLVEAIQFISLDRESGAE